jgi:hypothetical protein
LGSPVVQPAVSSLQASSAPPQVALWTCTTLS